MHDDRGISNQSDWHSWIIMHIRNIFTKYVVQCGENRGGVLDIIVNKAEERGQFLNVSRGRNFHDRFYLVFSGMNTSSIIQVSQQYDVRLKKLIT